MAQLEITSALGGFVIALEESSAPVTCAYFARLAEEGAYHNGSVFRIVTTQNHVVEEGAPLEVVQLGTARGIEAPRVKIPHEDTAITGLRHRRWTVSAARFGQGEVYGSFFVCMRDEPALDFGGARQPDGAGFAAFGTVSSGFETLTTMHARAEATEYLTRPIAVRDIRLIR